MWTCAGRLAPLMGLPRHEQLVLGRLVTMKEGQHDYTNASNYLGTAACLAATSRFAAFSAGLFTVVLLASVPVIASAGDVDSLIAQGKFCSATAQAAFQACGHQTLDDYWIAFGICINESDSKDRAECFADAKSTRSEDDQLCKDQREARLEACDPLGEGRYDPDFEAADFDKNFANLSNPNRYFPLGIGNQWEFRSATQYTKVRVLNETKLIDDVRCIVVRDEVFEDGVIIEGTNDWFAQAKDGNVWYCGEETASFETFKGDKPMKPEVVSIDGSFKAGRDGDKPGIIFQANPSKGEFYVEESSLGNAEDADGDPVGELRVRQEHGARSARAAQTREAALRRRLCR